MSNMGTTYGRKAWAPKLNFFHGLPQTCINVDIKFLSEESNQRWLTKSTMTVDKCDK